MISNLGLGLVLLALGLCALGAPIGFVAGARRSASGSTPCAASRPISAAHSATQDWMICLVARVLLSGAMILLDAREHMRSKARLQIPSQRIQWWIRPGPRRSWARRNWERE